MTARLSVEYRNAALRRVQRDDYDIIVIGGGIAGVGAALDAATRGLRVALFEAQDLASGTSSRSGKTFHGGLRYLEQLNIGLVRQALHERGLMVQRLCPYLTRPYPFLYPLTHRGWERAYLGVGVGIYDLLGGSRHGIPFHRHLGRAATLREAPALREQRIIGGVQYYDVLVDDARHTMMVARTAADHGAVILTRVKVTGMIRDDSGVRGVTAIDTESGRTLTVRGHAIINATGAWAEEVQRLAGPVALRIRPAKGVHIVVPKGRINARTGLITRTPDSVLAIRPWGDHWIIGTTDTPYGGGLDEPVATEADIGYLLRQCNRWLRRPLTSDDITGTYAGLRPLVAVGSNGSGDTTRLSRDHAIAESVPGLITVAGGKYTTYRVMAADAVDRAAARIPRTVPACRTAHVPLLGTAGWDRERGARHATAAQAGVALFHIDRLLARYGSLTTELLNMIADRPGLGAPVPGAPGYLQAEIAYAATHEGALHLDDVLLRRTHIGIETPGGGAEAAPTVTWLLAETLGWDEVRGREELARYKRRFGGQETVQADSVERPPP